MVLRMVIRTAEMFLTLNLNYGNKLSNTIETSTS